MGGPVTHTLPSRVGRRFSAWPSTRVKSGTSDLHFSYDQEIELTLGADCLRWALGSLAQRAGTSFPHHRAILPPLVVSPTWLSRFGVFSKCLVKCFTSVIPEQLDINSFCSYLYFEFSWYARFLKECSGTSLKSKIRFRKQIFILELCTSPFPAQPWS